MNFDKLSNVNEIEPIILNPVQITKNNFGKFGEFSIERGNRKTETDFDVSLDIMRGQPLLYIMNLPYKELEFNKISRHNNCSQCLGSVTLDSWYIAVCPPNNDSLSPDLSKIELFLVPPQSFIKLNPGTWHEGPFFSYPLGLSFFNLEHVDTVENDYETFEFKQKHILNI